MRLLSGVALIALCLGSGACHGLKPESFAGAEPRFEPEKFFEGPSRSWGVTENRSGQPASRFRADIMGRREGGDLVITQDFTFQDGRKQRRVRRAKPPCARIMTAGRLEWAGWREFGLRSLYKEIQHESPHRN